VALLNQTDEVGSSVAPQTHALQVIGARLLLLLLPANHAIPAFVR
jgi:hypothetical protein